MADPAEIAESWQKYWNDTREDASIFGYNCAVATQWFLNKFAGIPQPDSSNFSLNYLSCGIVWPSFIPCFVTLPGRIFSNAKFQVEAKNNPEMTAQYNRLLEYIYKALLVLACAVTSTLAVAVVLPLALAALTVAAILTIVSVVAAASDNYHFASNNYHFFKNKDSLKEIFSDKHFDDMHNLLSNRKARTPMRFAG